MEIMSGMRGQWAPLKTYTFLSERKRISQESAIFPRAFKISIIVALRDIPEQYLREMIESVITQTYGNWELYLIDGSGNDSEGSGTVCGVYEKNDARIKYRKSAGNLDMAEKLNKAIEMSSGEFLGLLDQGDILHPSALYEVMKVLCDEGADFIYSDEALFSDNHNITLKYHKPDYAIDTLCSHNYIGRFIIFDRALAEKAGVFRSEFAESYDYDLIFRYTDIASKIYHISKLLYFRRNDEETAAADITKKMEGISAAEKTINEYLITRERPGRAESKTGLPGFYRVIYELPEKPLVSIIIPNKDNASLLRDCLSSILDKTTYTNYEVIVIENNSSKATTFAFYEELKSYENVRVVYWEGKGFNFSEICNFGVQRAHGQQLIFLNNDVLIISPDWIEEMLMYSQRHDVGAVGAKLYYSNGSIQHAGVILGLGGIAGHIYHGAPRDAVGYMGKLQIAQNMSAVTAACMMVRRQVFEEAGQFDPEFPYSFNDVDLCIKIRKAGYLVVWTPYAEAYHLESRSRGYNTSSKMKRRLIHETALFEARWNKELAMGDPYYNRNFSLDKVDYKTKIVTKSTTSP